MKYKALSERNLRIVPLLGPMTNADRARRNPRNPNQLITRSTLDFNMMACLSNPESMKLNVALDLAWRHRRGVKRCVTIFVVATVKKHLYTMQNMDMNKDRSRLDHKRTIFADLATISSYIGLNFERVVRMYANQMRVKVDTLLVGIKNTP